LNINISIPDIPDFDALFNEIQKVYNQVMEFIGSFTLQCPPEPSQTAS
jgi:hypothetical protein